MNKVTLIGRLAKEPVLRKTQNGTAVVSFTIACSRKVAKDQEPQADFINCTAWNRTAEIIKQYTSKGSQIAIDGRIQVRSYEDDKGKRTYVTEVVCESVELLGSKKAAEEPAEVTSEFFDETPGLTIDSDDLPF